jgi:hypothetical protein
VPIFKAVRFDIPHAFVRLIAPSSLFVWETGVCCFGERKKMKRASLAAALLAVLGFGISGAQARSTQPTVNWTGFYIGGHGGYQRSTIDLEFHKELPGLGNGVSLETDGGMGGVHGGVQQ